MDFNNGVPIRSTNQSWPGTIKINPLIIGIILLQDNTVKDN